MVLALALGACAAPPLAGGSSPGQGPAPRPAERKRSRPTISVRSLMDVCWPRTAGATERVRLTFFLEEGRLKDIVFEPSGGASNATGRCLQQIAWEYPWPAEPVSIPEFLDVTPPAARPSGWYYLAYNTLLAEGAHGEDRGLLAPAPLVRACMSNGAGIRPHIRFRVQTHPVRVSVFFELSEVERPDQRRTEADLATTDSERCIKAVLGATVYPGTRNFEMEFSDLTGAPPAAPGVDVAAYFAPGEAADVSGTLEPMAVRERMAEQQASVAGCWEAALARRSGLFGARTFRMRIGTAGEVSFAHVIANRSDRADEAEDFLLDRCIAEGLSKVRFPPIARGSGAEVAYSFIFARR